MAQEKFVFFDSTEGDERIYTADEFAGYFRAFLTNGVLNLGTCLKIENTETALTLKANFGLALINGYAYWLLDDTLGDKTIVLDAPDSVSDRYDRIVLRLDLSTANRKISIEKVTGTAAASPEVPDITRDGNIYELALGYVPVYAGNTILGAVVDERADQDVCGMINSLITLDTADLQAQFDAFMETLEGATYVSVATWNDYINQHLLTTSDVQFNKVTANAVIGGVYQ